MIHIEKEENGEVLVVRIKGSIEETAHFEKLIGPPSPATYLMVYCAEVVRINSVGTKAWIRYFQQCREKGAKLSFHELPTCLVDQANLISDFLTGAHIESIFLPFCCRHCGTHFLGLQKVEQLRADMFKIDPSSCTKCNQQAEFDDLPQHYLSFLMRRS
jgi:hypothetical protein